SLKPSYDAQEPCDFPQLGRILQAHALNISRIFSGSCQQPSESWRGCAQSPRPPLPRPDARGACADSCHSGTRPDCLKQLRYEAHCAGIPESAVLYCACHRFSTDAMEGTGNVMAVMDAMGHGSVNTTRIYTHSNVQQIREAIERRNQLSSRPVEAVQKLATKVATVA